MHLARRWSPIALGGRAVAGVWPVLGSARNGVCRRASQEFFEQAVENGLDRLGDVQKLKKWIGYSSC
jgi:hypothetical protein